MQLACDISGRNQAQVNKEARVGHQGKCLATSLVGYASSRCISEALNVWTGFDIAPFLHAKPKFKWNRYLIMLMNLNNSVNHRNYIDIIPKLLQMSNSTQC